MKLSRVLIVYYYTKAMKAPSVYSIDAGLPFAEQVVRGLMAIADTPEQLARALVLVPSQKWASSSGCIFVGQRWASHVVAAYGPNW